MIDDSETPHYNGLLVVGPKELEGKELGPSKYLPLNANDRLIRNPFFTLNLDQGLAYVDSDQLSGFAAEMLSRHPCYEEYLEELHQNCLTASEVRLLVQAQRGLTLEGIASELNLSLDVVLQIAKSLCDRELLHAAPISKAMWELQNFYSFVDLPTKVAYEFSVIWKDLSAKYQSRPMIHWLYDESELMFEDVDFLVNATRAALLELKVTSGKRIGIASSHHPAALILSWACWLEGICVVFLDETQPSEMIHSLKTESDLVFYLPMTPY